jgi:hypothetical protein
VTAASLQFLQLVFPNLKLFHLAGAARVGSCNRQYIYLSFSRAQEIEPEDESRNTDAQLLIMDAESRIRIQHRVCRLPARDAILELQDGSLQKAPRQFGHEE